ncbi:MAG: efflux RND transporter permease subunit [Bacteroidetes bacterium]|nr:efflux RND transporter permease subunit [Bacteroidota bacterium]
MRKIIEKFVEFPVYANLIIAVVILAGGVSFLSLNKAFFPETESRYLTVSVFYPGASPVEMEEGVTTRIEEAVRGLIGIKEINSTSMENRCSVSIETTGEYPINEILQEVKNAVDGISSLPSAAERPIVSKRRSMAAAMRLELVPLDEHDVGLMALKEYAQRIEEDFLNSGVMSQISLSGYPQPEISVEIREQELLRYNITFDQIVRAIQNNNQDVSGGELKSEEEEYLIRLRSRSANPEKIGNIILRGESDAGYIHIRDVAEVKVKFADSPNRQWTNGKPSVSINVEKLPEEDLDEITQWANKYIEEFNSRNQGVEIIISRAYLDILKSRLDLLTRNGMLGLTLVIISLSMFLSFRLSLWVSWGIPFSFLAMFVAAHFLGVTINLQSLFGMILVIGILVDDGIVIAENIYLHFEKGKSPMHASVDGTMEVLPAVLTSVATTIVAFAPLLFLAGTRMEMMMHVAIVVIASLFFSLFEAFLVLPAHLASDRVLSRKSLEAKNKGIKKYFERLITWLRDRVYRHYLDWAVKWRFIASSIPVALVLITAGLFMGGHIKNTFFPMVDFDSFYLNVAFTPGDGEKQTLDFLEEFEKAIWEVNDEISEEMGLDHNIIERTSKGLGSAFNGQERGAHAGSINVYPVDLEGYDISGRDISTRVTQKIGKVPEARKFTVAGRNRWGSPVSIGLMSKNLDELEEAKEFMLEKLSEMPQLKDVNENIALGKQEIRLDLKPRAYFLGLDEATIARQVRQGFYGAQAQRLQVGRDELRVWVRYPKSDRVTLGQMENMKIKTSSGEYPLSELADYHMERGPVAINRFNGSREIRVEAETVDPMAPVPDILEQIEHEIMPELQAQFAGIRYIYQGQQKYSKEAMGQAGKYYIFAFAIIFLILVTHFRSVPKAFIIILMIPISLLGVAWGHGLHGQPLSIMSMWGAVALTGVIINDAIVFFAKYDGLLLAGKSVKEAVKEAGKVRLRPIILTSLTTSIGLFPMLFEKSVQAQFLIPMAISLAYGVALGTIFILLFFPVLILLLNDAKVYSRYLWTGVKPTPEEVETSIIQNKRKLRFESNRGRWSGIDARETTQNEDEQII